MTDENRRALETQIAKAAIEELLGHNFALSVNDGEETTLRGSRNVEQVLAAMFTTDEDYLYVHAPVLGTLNPPRWYAHSFGWVQFVYGNSGWDVICNYSSKLEDYLTQTNALADKLGDA